MLGLLGGHAHRRLPGGQRLARLLGADAPGDGHLDRLIGHAEQLLAGRAQPGLRRGRHDGHHVLEALARAVGHGLRVGKDLLHDGLRRVHDLAQVGKGVFGADGQCDRHGHGGPGHGRAQQAALEIGPLGAQGIGLRGIGGQGLPHVARPFHLPRQAGIVRGQPAHAAAYAGRLRHGLAVLARLPGERAGQAAHLPLGLLDLAGQGGAHGPGLLGPLPEARQMGLRLPQVAAQAADLLLLGLHGRADAAHRRSLHLPHGAGHGPGLSGGPLEGRAVAAGQACPQGEGERDLTRHASSSPRPRRPADSP